jgi:hypothetical protein
LQNNSKPRKFIRHPTDVPILVSSEQVPEQSERSADIKLHNVSLGGLAFVSSHPLPTGKQINICFPLLDAHRSLQGLVVWCKQKGKDFEVGLQFDDPDELYRLRMIEQICHIEHYRHEIEQVEGRKLNSEEAAREWIQRYASEFPVFNGADE